MLQKHFPFIQICVFLSQFFVGYKFQVFSFFMKIFYDLLLTNTEYFYFFLFALGIKKGRTCKSLFVMLVTLPLLYTLSTSIKVNANKLIQVSVHALTDYPFFLITLGIMLCRYLSNNVVRNSDKFSFIFIFFFLLLLLVCLCIKNKHVPIIIIVELHNIYIFTRRIDVWYNNDERS